MFPINRTSTGQIVDSGSSLHSTMFPINPGPGGHVPGDQVSGLYIPLCFLLIRKRLKEYIQSLWTLHSTMFPINPAERIRL